MPTSTSISSQQSCQLPCELSEYGRGWGCPAHISKSNVDCETYTLLKCWYKMPLFFVDVDICKHTCNELIKVGFGQSKLVPRPSCPLAFRPNAYTPPDSVRAQVCASPHAT